MDIMQGYLVCLGLTYQGINMREEKCRCCWPPKSWLNHHRFLDLFKEIRENKGILDKTNIDSAPFVAAESELVETDLPGY
jgi:hypothetical protein